MNGEKNVAIISEAASSGISLQVSSDIGPWPSIVYIPLLLYFGRHITLLLPTSLC
jgi:hypothetical protein